MGHIVFLKQINLIGVSSLCFGNKFLKGRNCVKWKISRDLQISDLLRTSFCKEMKISVHWQQFIDIPFRKQPAAQPHGQINENGGWVEGTSNNRNGQAWIPKVRQTWCLVKANNAETQTCLQDLQWCRHCGGGFSLRSIWRQITQNTSPRQTAPSR